MDNGQAVESERHRDILRSYLEFVHGRYLQVIGHVEWAGGCGSPSSSAAVGGPLKFGFDK